MGPDARENEEPAGGYIVAVIEAIGRHLRSLSVVGAVTFLGASGTLPEEAVVALLMVTLVGPAAFAAGTLNGRRKAPGGREP